MFKMGYCIWDTEDFTWRVVNSTVSLYGLTQSERILTCIHIPRPVPTVCTTKLKCNVNSANWLAGIHNFHRQHKACRRFRRPEGQVIRQLYSERYLCIPHHLGWGTNVTQQWCWCFLEIKYSFIQVNWDTDHYFSCFATVLPPSFHTT